MKQFFHHPWAWTSLAPGLCAAHCAATPLVVAVFPAFAPGQTTEWMLLGATVVLVLPSVGSGLRTHGNARPMTLASLGLAVWVLSLLQVFHPLPEDPITAVAAATVAVGLVWNSRLHCWAGQGGCRACSAETPALRRPFSIPAASARPVGTSTPTASSMSGGSSPASGVGRPTEPVS